MGTLGFNKTKRSGLNFGWEFFLGKFTKALRLSFWTNRGTKQHRESSKTFGTQELTTQGPRDARNQTRPGAEQNEEGADRTKQQRTRRKDPNGEATGRETGDRDKKKGKTTKKGGQSKEHSSVTERNPRDNKVREKREETEHKTDKESM